MLRTLLCLLCVVGLGCSQSNPGTLPGAPKGANEEIVQVRDMLLESAIMAMPLANEKDLPNFEGKFPKATAAVKSKSVVVVWGKSFKEGANKDSAIIAYEAKATTDGGWVVREDGELYELSSADFAAQAPKAK
jgi:hypothetical protein